MRQIPAGPVVNIVENPVSQPSKTPKVIGILGLVTLSGLLLLTLIPTLRTLSQLQECQNGDTACTTDSWKAVSHYFGAVSTALLATAFLFIGACIGTGNFLAMAPYQKTRNIAMGIGFLVSLALCITQFNYRANRRSAPILH